MPFSLAKYALISALALLAVGAVIYAAFLRDMAAIRQRLAEQAKVVDTRFGAVEYTDWGSDAVVLALHGAGGGFDQGRVLAQAFGPEGYHWVAPSRFGYLGSTLPQDASTAAQADALVAMLDGLGIDRVAILAMSGGVPPALQMAERHPDRVSALVLLSSAPFTPLPTQQNDLPIPIWLYQALFRSDLPYWIISKIAPSRLEAAFDVPAGRRADLPTTEIAFIDNMLAAFLPVSQRQNGLLNEAAAIDPAARHDLGRITAPTLVVHARDDGLNPVSIAQYIAAKLPGASLMVTDSGGHLLLGHHDTIRRAIAEFLRQTSAFD